jgi:hypothetical protein
MMRMNCGKTTCVHPVLNNHSFLVHQLFQIPGQCGLDVGRAIGFLLGVFLDELPEL